MTLMLLKYDLYIYNKNIMRKLLTIVGLIIAFTSCAPQQQLISETPKTTRVAEIYSGKVVIVTKTTITKEHYNELVAARTKNSEEEGK